MQVAFCFVFSKPRTIVISCKLLEELKKRCLEYKFWLKIGAFRLHLVLVDGTDLPHAFYRNGLRFFHFKSRMPPAGWVYGSFGTIANVRIVELSLNLPPLILGRMMIPIENFYKKE